MSGNGVTDAKLFVNVNEFHEMIIRFIGTDYYNKTLEAISDSKSAGFMAGLLFAAALITSECDLHVVYEDS